MHVGIECEVTLMKVGEEQVFLKPYYILQESFYLTNKGLIIYYTSSIHHILLYTLNI